MTTENAIKLLNSIREIIMRDDSWLENTHEPINEAFNMAQKALKHGEWIPVSERLPEDEGWYLVTDDSGGVLWLEGEHYDLESGLEPFCTVQNPVAWMPLPEPYRDDDTMGGQI